MYGCGVCLVIHCLLSRYKTLLHDCHQCYVSQRGQLLTPTVMATIEHLKKVHTTDNCGLVGAKLAFCYNQEVADVQ